MPKKPTPPPQPWRETHNHNYEFESDIKRLQGCALTNTEIVSDITTDRRIVPSE